MTQAGGLGAGRRPAAQVAIVIPPSLSPSPSALSSLSLSPVRPAVEMAVVVAVAPSIAVAIATEGLGAACRRRDQYSLRARARRASPPNVRPCVRIRSIECGEASRERHWAHLVIQARHQQPCGGGRARSDIRRARHRQFAVAAVPAEQVVLTGSDQDDTIQHNNLFLPAPSA